MIFVQIVFYTLLTGLSYAMFRMANHLVRQQSTINNQQ